MRETNNDAINKTSDGEPEGLTSSENAGEATVEDTAEDTVETVQSTASKGSVFRVGLTLLFVAALGFLGGWPLLVMIAAFAISIIVHEFGHFLVAKRAGMKATEFFIGFGPKIFSFRRGETEYGLKAIPAGAYVRIIGMSDLESVPPAEENRTYRKQPYRWRLATVLAGPAANILLAFVILIGFYASTPQANRGDWAVQAIGVNSTAEELDLRAGDRITSVDGVSTSNYDDLAERISALPAKDAVFVIEGSDGSVREENAVIGWRLNEEGGELFSPLQTNDVIYYVNGNEVSSLANFVDQVEAVPEGDKFTLQFFRLDGIYEARVTKDQALSAGLSDASFAKGYVGLEPFFGQKNFTVVEATGESAKTIFRMGKSSVDSIVTFFSPSSLLAFGEKVVAPPATIDDTENAVTVLVPPSSENGQISSEDRNRVLSIVGVVRLGAQAAEASLYQFLLLWAIINIFLAVVNLLPLLPLDGGHAAVATWEKVKGVVTRNSAYRVRMEKLLPVSYAVIAIFVVVGLSAMWLDITSPISNPF